MTKKDFSLLIRKIMWVDFIHQNHGALESASPSACLSAGFCLTLHLIINNEDIYMSGYLEFSRKGMIVLCVLKYLSSNSVTLLQKNATILKRFLISFHFICGDFYQNKKENKGAGLLWNIVQDQFSFEGPPAKN